MNERTVFEAALEKEDAAQRTAYLDAACAGNAALRQRVETLLRAHAREGPFLDVPAVAQLAASCPQPDPADATQGEAPADDTEDPSLDFLAASAKPDSLGRLGHYEVLATIGRGGMGIVLKVFDEQLHRNVAIKVMAPQLATNALARKRFVREARAAAAVRNEHVINIHAVVEANDLPYLAMEYVAGVSLQERIDQGGPLPLAAILRIGMQTAAGLAAAHAQGLIHRDIKPSNILLENGVERVKITDFGLARAVDDVSLTQSGVIAGTPQYMSPEQARGEAVDHRTDLFSLGSVMYAMCTGRAPFRASGTMAVLKRVCEDAPRAIREVNPDTPEWLCAIIAKLQAKNPADRFQSAAEVAELLSQHLAHLQQPSLAPMPANPSPLSPLGLGAGGEGRSPSRRRWTIAAAVLLLAIGSIGMTEATGVTNLRATMIRIFTPDGWLVVEVDDPGVKVTIEGDGGIVITGAGPQEVRLRPGDYRVQASKDGKPVPLNQELVKISTRDRQIVKVTREQPRQLTQVEQLERAKQMWDEANELYTKAVGLRDSDPWEAERCLRQALSLNEKLVAEFPGTTKYDQRIGPCKFTLAVALNVQAHMIVFKRPPASAVEAQRAVELGKEAVTLVPQEKGFLSNLGRAYYRAKEFKMALATLEEAIDKGKGKGRTVDRFFIAMTHGQLGDKEKARASFDKGVQLMEQDNPRDEDLRRLRAEAAALLKIEDKSEPKLTTTPPMAAEAKLIVELEGYDATLKENPNDLTTLIKRGDVLRRLKRLHDAVAAYSTVIMNTSNQAERKSALWQRAFAQAELGQLQGTIEDYEEFLRDGDEGAWAYGRLATCYTFGPEKLRNPQRALEHAETAIRKRGAHADYHTLHGVCLYRVGRHREAIEALERAYEDQAKNKDGRTAMNRFFAAMAYQKLAEPAKAQECYAVALKLPQPTGHPGLIPNWVELMRAEAEAVLKFPAKK